MSSDKRWILSRIPPGSGFALDLGGGRGELGPELERRGYTYVNLDISPTICRRAVRGDAHRLPFRSETFDLIVSSDSLEHFRQPAIALGEIRRVIKGEGLFVVWVPFLHPFHGDDYYRYTPLGLRSLMADAELSIRSFDAPLWIFSVIAQALVALLARLGFSSLERWIERAAAWADQRLTRFQGRDKSFAAAFLVVASKDTR